MTEKNVHDAAEFVPLPAAATPTFTPKVVTADEAYGSRINVRRGDGSRAHIAMKSNTVAYST